MDEEVVSSARDRLMIRLLDSLQELSEPRLITYPYASPHQVVLRDADCDLNAAFPASFLYIEDASHMIRSIVRGFRPKKKGDAVLGYTR